MQSVFVTMMGGPFQFSKCMEGQGAPEGSQSPAQMAEGTSVDLICLLGSPWTSKALWVLDHAGVPFKRRPFEPMVDELWLRWKMGLWPWHAAFWRRHTVPIAILQRPREPKRILSDSFDIAAWAIGSGDMSTFRTWNKLSDVILDYARACFARAATRDVGLAIEIMAPRWLKKLPAFLVRMVMTMGVKVFAMKYRHENRESSDPAVVLQAVGKVREALCSGKGRYLVGDQFSYADIVMAIAVNGLSPSKGVIQFTVPSHYATEPLDVLKDFEDVKQWKDEVMKRHLPQMLREAP